MIVYRFHAESEDLVLVAHVLGGSGDQVAQAHLQRPRVADDVGLALVVGHLFFELPVLVGAHVDGGAQVVEVEHQAGSVPAEEVGGGRGEKRLGLALVCGELGAKHAEKGLSDVANDLVLGHGRHTATLGGDSPEVSAEVRGLRLFWENSPQSQAVDGRPARRASLLGENRQRIQSSELPQAPFHSSMSLLSSGLTASCALFFAVSRSSACFVASSWMGFASASFVPPRVPSAAVCAFFAMSCVDEGRSFAASRSAAA